MRGGALTAGYNSFAGAGHRFSIASGAQLRGASMYRGAPVGPSAAGYRFADRSVAANPRFSQAASRTFFNGSRYSSASGGSARVGGYAGSSRSGGWQSFGSPSPQHSTQGFSARPNNGSGEGGWHSFGQPQGAPRYTAPSQSYGAGGYRGSSSSTAAPHYNYSAPSAPRYNNSAPRYSALLGSAP